MKVDYGTLKDIESWMELVQQVRWNFPGLETQVALEDHRQTVLRFMGEHRALCMKDGDKVIGVLLISKKHNMICCLAVAPEYRRRGVASALLKQALLELNHSNDITVTTFREDDEKGIAPRAFYKGFGFMEGRLFTEFGYPVQEFVLKGTNMNKVSLQPMTREMCHAFYKGFQNDPAIGHYYEYVYTPEIADRYFEINSVSDRKLFAIIVGEQIVGECKLKSIDLEKRECSMGIHLRDDSVKGKGYGTQAEQLILRYAFGELGMVAVNADAALKNTRSQHVLEKVGFQYVRQDDTFKYYRCERVNLIRKAEAASHIEAYTSQSLFSPGSWLSKPVKTVLELLPLFEGYTQFAVLDLGSGVSRNSIPVAQYFGSIPCRVDCVDILELAITKLNENAQRYEVENIIQGIVSAIDDYEIAANSYDLIMAISALEHTASLAVFENKLCEIRDGLRHGGIACLIINSGVIEHVKETGQELPPQFEVNLPTSQMQDLLEKTFAGWQIIKHTIVHQKYDIPRENGIANLETDVVTYVVRKG